MVAVKCAGCLNQTGPFPMSHAGTHATKESSNKGGPFERQNPRLSQEGHWGAAPDGTYGGLGNSSKATQTIQAGMAFIIGIGDCGRGLKCIFSRNFWIKQCR